MSSTSSRSSITRESHEFLKDLEYAEVTNVSCGQYRLGGLLSYLTLGTARHSYVIVSLKFCGIRYQRKIERFAERIVETPTCNPEVDKVWYTSTGKETKLLYGAVRTTAAAMSKSRYTLTSNNCHDFAKHLVAACLVITGNHEQAKQTRGGLSGEMVDVMNKKNEELNKRSRSSFLYMQIIMVFFVVVWFISIP